MKNVACLGRYETIFPFKAIGLHTVQCNTLEDVKKAIEHLVKEGFGLIFVEEEFFKDLGELLDRYKEDVTPAIIAIPGAKGPTGDAMNRTREIIKKAIGTDIF